MKINFFEDSSHLSLKPLTFTRPSADLRIGILTIAEKWQKHLQLEYGFQSQEYLSVKYPAVEAQLWINGAVCPNEALLNAIAALKEGEMLLQNEVLIAFISSPSTYMDLEKVLSTFKPINFNYTFLRLEHPEDIFGYNEQELNLDFDLLSKGRQSQNLSSTNTILGDRIFVEEGANAECSTFNTLKGPIYLGKNSEVWEGSHIRGAFALCEHSSVKMGARIYANTTIGPHSRVGGEINNAVIWGYSSKGHDGYLGNAVMGEWCNIGADSNNSNLKNNYDEVKLWDYNTERFRKTGLQFCGIIMADHAKCAINTMFNTGTVVGVSANIFGAGFPRNFIPDFAWGGAHGFEVYALEKMFKTCEKVFERRNRQFNEVEKDILNHIFEETQAFRRF